MARRRGRRSRPLLATLGALAAALAAAGCVSMPTGGAVQSYPVTQGTEGPDAQGQPYVQVVAGPPGAGWSPTQIVQGFLTASASFGDQGQLQVAREYLAPQARRWTPSWSAIVYRTGPDVAQPVYSPAGKKASRNKKAGRKAPDEATVTIDGKRQATLNGNGLYAVPSASGPQGPAPVFTLVKVAAQWRISKVPPYLLLTTDSFNSDYQRRNLYFFDPQTRFLVPDPVYVPLQATPSDLMDRLVDDLITPPNDWLAAGATRTAFPRGTKLLPGGVTLDGVTAVVNLGGIAAAPSQALNQTMQQVSAQLLRTLTGLGLGGQAVQSIDVLLNGRPWVPPDSQGDPVQTQSKYKPATGASGTFYYLDNAGDVISQHGPGGSPVPVAQIGTGFSQIAISPDGDYLAAIKKGELFTGPLGGPLARRIGTGYTTISWDPGDNLWATDEQGDQIVMLPSDSGPRQQPYQVDVKPSGVSGPFTGIRVAPDGVRVALIIGGDILDFGAISWQEGNRPGHAVLQIALSAFSQQAPAFSSVTWYGPDNVITLGPGPAVTEYPVNGSAPTSIPVPAEGPIRSITASAGYPLIAGIARNRVVSDASLTGSWDPIATGSSPVYPG